MSYKNLMGLKILSACLADRGSGVAVTVGHTEFPVQGSEPRLPHLVWHWGSHQRHCSVHGAPSLLFNPCDWRRPMGSAVGKEVVLTKGFTPRPDFSYK